MLKYFSHNIIIITLLLCPLGLFAQKMDTAKHRADTLRYKFRPTGVRIGTDLISIAKSKYVESFTGWEVNADVDFYRYYLAVDYGSWGRTYFPDSGKYKNTGRYYRVGVDVNFLTKDPEKNMFFIGLHHGHSVFSEHLTITVVDPVLWGSADLDYQNNNIKANWFELTSGLRVRMWKIIWMGYTGHFKFAMRTSNTQEMLPSDIPGYGRTDKKTTWGFNYQIFVRLPISKRK